MAPAALFVCRSASSDQNGAVTDAATNGIIACDALSLKTSTRPGLSPIGAWIWRGQLATMHTAASPHQAANSPESHD